MYPYMPQNEDELELVPGDFVFMSPMDQSSTSEGWVNGTSLATGLSGLLPENYVSLADESDTWVFHGWAEHPYWHKMTQTDKNAKYRYNINKCINKSQWDMTVIHSSLFHSCQSVQHFGLELDRCWADYYEIEFRTFSCLWPFLMQPLGQNLPLYTRNIRRSLDCHEDFWSTVMPFRGWQSWVECQSTNIHVISHPLSHLCQQHITSKMWQTPALDF